MGESDLVRRAQEGDSEAFGGLVRLHQARLRAYAARYLTCSDDVHDVAQDAFLDAFQNMSRFGAGRDFYRWLRGICRNRILNHFRSRETRRRHSLALVDIAMAGRVSADEKADESAEEISAMKSCVEKMATEQQELIRERYFAERSVKEIAGILDRSAARVSMTLTRIRRALMKCMEQRLEGAGR